LRRRLVVLGMVFLVEFRRGRPWNVDIDVKPLEFQGDQIEGCYNDGVGGLDSLQGKYAELEFVQCSWCGILQGLDLK
jgi:hypothetical protein